MRTTISVDESLLREAKRRARRAGLTLGEFIARALRREMARPRPEGVEPEIPVFTGGTGLVPGVDPTSNRSMQEALDRGRTVEDLR